MMREVERSLDSCKSGEKNKARYLTSGYYEINNDPFFIFIFYLSFLHLHSGWTCEYTQRDLLVDSQERILFFLMLTQQSFLCFDFYVTNNSCFQVPLLLFDPSDCNFDRSLPRGGLKSVKMGQSCR